MGLLVLICYLAAAFAEGGVRGSGMQHTHAGQERELKALGVCILAPSAKPSATPTIQPTPTTFLKPTITPTERPSPTAGGGWTAIPTISFQPTYATSLPTYKPTPKPTKTTTDQPTVKPTPTASYAPSPAPTYASVVYCNTNADCQATGARFSGICNTTAFSSPSPTFAYKAPTPAPTVANMVNVNFYLNGINYQNVSGSNSAQNALQQGIVGAIAQMLQISVLQVANPVNIGPTALPSPAPTAVPTALPTNPTYAPTPTKGRRALDVEEVATVAATVPEVAAEAVAAEEENAAVSATITVEVSPAIEVQQAGSDNSAHRGLTYWTQSSAYLSVQVSSPLNVSYISSKLGSASQQYTLGLSIQREAFLQGLAIKPTVLSVSGLTVSSSTPTQAPTLAFADYHDPNKLSDGQVAAAVILSLVGAVLVITCVFLVWGDNKKDVDYSATEPLKSSAAAGAVAEEANSGSPPEDAAPAVELSPSSGV